VLPKYYIPFIIYNMTGRPDGFIIYLSADHRYNLQYFTFFPKVKEVFSIHASGCGNTGTS
jgi:hypothetical protein